MYCLGNVYQNYFDRRYLMKAALKLQSDKLWYLLTGMSVEKHPWSYSAAFVYSSVVSLCQWCSSWFRPWLFFPNNFRSLTGVFWRFPANIHSSRTWDAFHDPRSFPYEKLIKMTGKSRVQSDIYRSAPTPDIIDFVIKAAYMTSSPSYHRGVNV